MDEKENAPVDPVGQDVNSTGQGEPVDRSGPVDRLGPVGPQNTTEQSALLGLMTDGTENTPVYPGGPDMNSAEWDQPVDHACRAIPESEVEMSYEETYIRGLPIKSSLLRWDKGVLPGTDDPEFGPCAKRMLDEALARDADPLLDKAYPDLSNVWCKRISKKIWGEHDARLEEQGMVCTTPGCQCRIRARTMFPIFAKGMETDDSESELYAPLQRKRGRKYASLRKHETDVEDYFSDCSAEEDWIDESRYWWNRC